MAIQTTNWIWNDPIAVEWLPPYTPVSTGLSYGNSLPTREALANNANKANQMGNIPLSNYLGSLIQDLSNRDKTYQSLYDIYDTFGNNMYKMMWDRNSIYGSLNQDMLWKLSWLQKQYQDTYWPNGEMRQKVNQLYTNYGNYLVNKNAADRAYASWMANKYWLSDNARRIAENDAGLQGLSEILKIFDAETQALDNINKTFNTLTTDGLSKYKGIQDDYIKSLADTNFWVQTQMAQSLLELIANNEQAKNQLNLQKQYSGGWWWSSSATTTAGQPTQSYSIPNLTFIRSYKDDNWNIVVAYKNESGNVWTTTPWWRGAYEASKSAINNINNKK